MNFVQDITERFLINTEKIELIDHKPDGTWWVVVRNRSFEVTEKTVKMLVTTVAQVKMDAEGLRVWKESLL